MSITTWKKEFYPKELEKTTIAESVEHSIRKWTGLLQKNLKKHRLYRDGAYIFNKERGFKVCGPETCSLCHHFYEKKFGKHHDCGACPLFKATRKACGYHDNNQYDRVIDDKESPMILINALKKARKFLPKT